MLPIVGKDWTMTRRQVGALANDALVEALADLELDIQCRRCGKPIRGNNSPAAREYVLECKCRTIRYQKPA
jgi:hypothetical protein